MMFYFIIALIIAAALVLIYSTVRRRGIYKQIDQFETWKIDIMNRPVTQEIARIKQLNVIGETEENFNKWRREWDEILTQELPAVEEGLFDAEESVDKFRFHKAAQVLQSIKEKLEKIETHIEKMLSEISEVVDSEQQNREDSESVKTLNEEIEETLLSKRHEYKTAIIYIEGRLKEIAEWRDTYETKTAAGEYVEAREYLLKAYDALQELDEHMKDIPDYQREIHTEIPKELRHLEAGYHEMSGAGFTLSHLNIEEQIDAIQKHLTVYEEAMNEAEFDRVKEGITETHEQIDRLYNQLEREAESRSQLGHETSMLEKDLNIVRREVAVADEETDALKDGYEFTEEDAKIHHQINHDFEKMEKEFTGVIKDLETKAEAYSMILEKVEDMRLHVDELRINVENYREKIKVMRKDELIGRETIAELKNKLQIARRLVQKSNMPGVPESYFILFDDAEEILKEASAKLDEKPLRMQTVNQLLDDANKVIDEAYGKTVKLVEAAEKSEALIQYGNRYRSSYPAVGGELLKAEDFFRNYNYEEALDTAAEAIAKIDPSIYEKFEIKETVR